MWILRHDEYVLNILAVEQEDGNGHPTALLQGIAAEGLTLSGDLGM